MKVYIATSLDSAAIHRAVAATLRVRGWTLTYDWTAHGSVQHAGPERIAEVAALELRGVRRADVVVVILPGGRGTHVELGAALGLGLPVVLCVLDHADRDELGRECAFYRSPGVHRVKRVADIPGACDVAFATLRGVA